MYAMVQLLLAFFLGGRVSRSVDSSGLANKGLKEKIMMVGFMV